MKKKEIEVIVVRPMEKPFIQKIENSLGGYYKAIGCDYIEAVYPFDDPVALVCDEEGKFGQMPNRALKMDGKVYDVVFGTFFICGAGGANFTSIPEKLKEKYMEMFQFPEAYIKNGEKVLRVVIGGSEPAEVVC